MSDYRQIAIYTEKQAEKVLMENGFAKERALQLGSSLTYWSFSVENLSREEVEILAAEMGKLGGFCVQLPTSGSTIDDGQHVIISGAKKTFTQLETAIRTGYPKAQSLAKGLTEAIQSIGKEHNLLKLGDYLLPIGKRTIIMGILNLTPDSFSDGGKFFNLEKAVEHAWQMREDGADIIDIGAESTRPGHQPVTAQEEIARLTPVVKRLLKEVKVPISIDTYKAETAEAMLDLGVHMINDVWGFKKDSQLPKVVAKYQAPIILMHNQDGTAYQNIMKEILASLRWSIATAEEAGIKPKQIILDPGIGFGKNLEQNLTVMNRLEEFHVLGKILLLGTSRKSMIGKTLDLPVEERLEGTAATNALGIAKGVQIIRIHDVKEMTRMAKMMDAMLGR